MRISAKCVLLVAICVGTRLGTVAQDDRVLPDLFEKVRPSVVSVSSTDASGRIVSRGTGFAVTRTHIVTNFHVLNNSTQIQIETSERRKFRVTRVVAGSNESDLAILEVSGLDLTPLTFSARSARVGERIIVVGNPFGLSGTLSDGLISGFRSLTNLGQLLQITAPISPGSSGSPVLNFSGEVVGLATLNLPDGQNLNFAIDSREISKLVPNLKYKASRINTSKRWRWLLSEKTTYDTETWTLVKGIHSVWIRYEEDNGSYAKNYTQINCETNQIRTLRRLVYDRNGQSSGETKGTGEWDGIIPDSNGETYYKIFCKNEPDYQGLEDYFRRGKLIDQGSTLLEKKEYAKAEAIYKELADEFPQTAGYASLQLGSIQMELGNLDLAEVYMRKATTLEPSDSYFYDTLGDLLEKRNKTNEAIEAYWNALRFDKNHSQSEWRLYELYERSKDFAGEVKLYQYLNSLGQVDFIDDLGNALEKQGKQVLARSTRTSGVIKLRQLISGGKASEYNYSTLASLYTALKQTAKSESVLIAGLVKYPDNFSLSLDLASNYMKRALWGKAIPVLESAASSSKDNLYRKILLRRLKDCYQSQGDSNQVKALTKQIADIPD